MTATTAAPVCEECDTPLARVGTGEQQYWGCRYCGTTRPIG